jgi:hypothetical protein
MKTVKFESREEWLNWRLGKITGSVVKQAVNLKEGGTKPGVYRAAAESLIGSAAIDADDYEDPMERGHRLEPVALDRFEKETGKKVKRELVGWERDDDSRMAVSPDGVIGKTAAVEVKCLAIGKHLEALYTQNIPKNTAGYEEQLAQYFIVNKALKTVYYVFYDDRFPAPLDFFYLTFTRKDLKADIAMLEALERDAVSKVREIVNAVSLYSPGEIAAVERRKQELLAEASERHQDNLKKISAAVAARV